MSRKDGLFDLPQYRPSKRARDVLLVGRIASPGKAPQDLLERVATSLFPLEEKFGTAPKKIKMMAEEFAGYMVEGLVIPGTPALTNIGRYESALSSCVVIPVKLDSRDNFVEKTIISYYKQNMGSGFDLTGYKNPVELLLWINKLSARETATGQYDRYIGNIATLHISHPRIKEFIDAKQINPEIIHFNISVDVTEDFFKTVEDDKPYVLLDGTRVSSSGLLRRMAENAWDNGDPGLIFLERMNKDNPISQLNPYVSTAPCSEMGLAQGETCQFGYLNIGKFVKLKKNGAVSVDYHKLDLVTQLLTRVLDNAVEYSFPHYPTEKSAQVAQLNRKIGIGVCGLADLLIAHTLPYDSVEARNLARDLLSFINYTSKWASVKLAKKRGSCLAMNFPRQNKYLSGRFLEEKYGANPTRTVSLNDWENLANYIRKTRRLRNILTTALPPTGRSSILLETTASIEPLFSIYDHNYKIKKNLLDFLSRKLKKNSRLLNQIVKEAKSSNSFQNIKILPPKIRECLKTAREISPVGHIRMVVDLAGMNGVVDEAASKTINLPNRARIDEVREIFLLTYRLGLKNISVYRDGSKKNQPERL